jgi:hypothetical protein
MTRAYTNVRLSEELDPIMRRAKGLAQASFYRAIESVTNPRAPVPTPGSIEEVLTK